MTTKEKPVPGWHRETGDKTTSNGHNDNPFALRLEALLIRIAANDPALLALLFLILWGALP